MENKEIFDNALKELEELKEVIYSQKLKYVNIIKFNLEDIKDALIKSQEQDKILELIKKCYYVSSIDNTLYKTSYGFDNPQDIIKIGEVLTNE